MKMLFIVYSRESDDAVMTAFKDAGMRGYTKVKDVCGEGGQTEPKLGSHIWPGINNALFVMVEDEAREKALDVIRKLKDDHPRTGLKAFVLPLEEVV